MIEKLINIDKDLFLFLNGIHNYFFDTVMWFITNRYVWIPLYLFIIGAVIFKFKKKSILAVPFMALSAALSDHISVHYFKNVFQRLRPSHNPEFADIIHLVNDYTGGFYSFVSSHAANTFALAMFVSLLYKNKTITSLIFAWAAIVSYSRIYLGVHYPADITGGALLGSFIAAILFAVYRLLVKKIKYFE